MSKSIRLAATFTLVVGLGIAAASPVSATECTPKGCTGGCKLGDPRDAHIDLDTLTVDLGDPIECYS